VPGDEASGPGPRGLAAPGLPAALDYGALLAGLASSGALEAGEDQDAALAERLAAEREGRLGPPVPAERVAALAVEHMAPGPAQAGWLSVAAAAAGRLDENELAGVATAARQLSSWVQACELAAVAQIASRAAAADPKIGVSADGRPGRVCRDALGQVALALSLTHYGAEWWADLGVTLAWRLPATGAALASGAIDLYRARLIAEATSVLGEDAARAVEQQELPGAGARTAAELRARLRRAVIAADPAGAEERRKNAERHAKVSLYGDDDHTATLTASKLPAALAAAAMARITAIARAMQAAGEGGSLDLHRAQVMLGLLLGTLRYIPPAEGAPPDDPPPAGDGPPDDPPPAGDGPPDDPPPAGDAPPDDPPPAGDDPAGPCDGGPGPGGEAGPDGARGGGPGPGGQAGPDGGARDGGDSGPADDGFRDDLPAPVDRDAPPESGICDQDAPAPRDEDAPPDDGLDDDDTSRPESGGCDPAEEDEDLIGTGPVSAWPEIGVIPPALARRPAAAADGRPVPGLLDAVVPWTTLAGLSQAPGTLGRIGPITAAQARLLAQAAESDPAAQWRVIVTNSAGQAIAVARIRRFRSRARAGPAQARAGPPEGTGLVGRMTVTITQDVISQCRLGASGPGPPGGIAAAALRTATRALDRALDQAEEDRAFGGCAHQDWSLAYRPPPRLREYVIARDLTCRSPVCRQPAWRADLDHTHPWDKGGRTCRCNLGGGCRRDHQLKQHPRWKLEQTRPGYFTWTTPAGRSYTVRPDTHPL
jgi:Domain of unknown function (DUF222)